MKCPACGFEGLPGMRYCGSCGTRLTVTCTECGFANPSTYQFCGMCGTRLAMDQKDFITGPLSFQPSTSETKTLPASASPQLEGERRVVSVVLTDLTDSTHLLEEVGTEDWVETMNRILHILESEIYRFGGEVSQFRGDGLVAFFGARTAHEDDPERAVLAALAMQRALNYHLRELAQSEIAELQLRVGVNTGEVIVAGGSDRHQWQETAMGVAVAIAARMETAAEPGTVLVSEHTYRLLHSQFDWQPLGEISIKGMSQPISVYRPLRHITDMTSFSYEEIFPDAMPRIGREKEFHILKQSVEELFQGRGGIVTLTSEKGAGKTFLLHELQQYFTHREALLAEAQTHSSDAKESPVYWARGRCRSYSQRWAYALWFDLFRDWLESRADETREEKSANLRRRAEALWGQDFDEHYPYLATFLGLPLEKDFSEKIEHLDGEGLRQRSFLAVRSWIEATGRTSPVVLVFSDLQWADDSSLELLKYCLPICDREAVMFLFSFRSEPENSIENFHHHLSTEYPHRLRNVNLPPLTEEQSHQLINHLIGPETLPPETCDLILRSAGGNPYYILELIRSLIDNGVLVGDRDGGAWRLTRRVTTLDLPESLHRLLLARMDRLSSQQKSVLQVSSVIGSVFWMNMVQSLLDSPLTLQKDITILQRNQFIEESGRVPELGMQYTFKSPLIRETAYDSLLSTQKAVYHLKIAQYIEDNVNPGVLDDYDGILAYHFRGAGNIKKELFYVFLAAEQARRIYANSESLKLYTRAIELLDILEVEGSSKDLNRSIHTQRFEALMGRRAVGLDLGQMDAARSDTRALLALAHQMPDDRIWLIDALLANAEFPANSREELRPDLQMAEQALDLSRELGDKRRELSSLMSVARIRLTLRESNSLAIAEEALALARQLGDLRTEVSMLLRIGNAYGIDNLSRSREYLEAALARSESLKDKRIEALLLEALGRQFERDGDYYRQLTQYEQKRLKLSREIGNRYVEGQTLMFCGQLEGLYLGDYESGLKLEREVLQIWEPNTSRLFPLLRIAQILTAQGKYADALAALEIARPLADKVVMDIGRAGLAMVTVILSNSVNDEPRLWEALELINQIQQMTTDNVVSRQYRMAAACEASDTHLKLAQCFVERDKNEYWKHLTQALESSQNAVDLYQHFGFVQIVECTSEEILYRHSQALAANGRSEEAKEFLERAYKEMMRKHDLIPSDSPFRKTFLENIQLHVDIQNLYPGKSTPKPRRRKKSNPSGQ